jgi:hypothetical protein
MRRFFSRRAFREQKKRALKLRDIEVLHEHNMRVRAEASNAVLRRRDGEVTRVPIEAPEEKPRKPYFAPLWPD